MEKYTVELTVAAGELLCNLLMKNMDDLHLQITLDEYGWRKDLHNKIHPANNPERTE